MNPNTLKLGSSDESRFILNYFFELSSSRMVKHCPALSFSGGQFEVYDQAVELGEEFTMVFLWGELGSIVLKTHYHLENARAVAGKAFGQKDASALNPDTIRAFMNEYSNLTGGYFRGVMEASQSLIGMSLPFVARAADESCFFKIRDPRYLYSRWQISCAEGFQFHCSSEILLTNPDVLKSLKQPLQKSLDEDKIQGNSGDIEFL